MDAPRGLRPDLLFFAAFFATLPLYSPNLTLFQDGFAAAEELMGPFVQSMLVSAALAGVALALASSRRGGAVFLGAPAVVGGSLLYVGGYGLFAAQLVLGWGAGPAAILAGAAVALGAAELCVAWGALLSCLGLRTALLCLALTVGGGSVIELLVSTVPAAVGAGVFALLLAAGVAVPCARALAGRLEADLAGEGAALAADAAAAEEAEGGAMEEALTVRRRDGESFPALVRRMVAVVAVPLAGLLVLGYITGVRKFMMFDMVYMETVGGVLAALIAVPLCMARTRRPLLPFFHQLILPSFALVLIVLNSFPEATLPLWFAAWLTYVFFALVGILALAGLCAMAHAREFPPALIYGLAVAGYAAVSLLGIFSGTTAPFQAHNGGPALLVVSTLYFAFLLAAGLTAGWRSGERAADASAPDASAALAERCERVAREAGLSPREGEILGYLGRGHSVAFIAKTLVISESTVRTHVKSIYRKLGVTSREDLIRFIDEERA